MTYFRSTIKLKIEAKSKDDADMIINVLMGHEDILHAEWVTEEETKKQR